MPRRALSLANFPVMLPLSETTVRPLHPSSEAFFVLTVMEVLTLDNLPKDVLVAVVDLIPRPTDLKSLCLTSKALREVAIPQLYKNVELDQDSPGYPFQPGVGFFRRGHPGHTHVRKLKMFCYLYDANARAFVKLALRIIPRDCLRVLYDDQFHLCSAKLC